MINPEETTFVNSDKAREILEYGIIIGEQFLIHQRDGFASFADDWECDSEIAEWAEKIIDEWVCGEQPEHYFTEFVQRRINEEQKAFCLGN